MRRAAKYWNGGIQLGVALALTLSACAGELETEADGTSEPGDVKTGVRSISQPLEFDSSCTDEQALLLFYVNEQAAIEVGNALDQITEEPYRSAFLRFFDAPLELGANVPAEVPIERLNRMREVLENRGTKFVCIDHYDDEAPSDCERSERGTAKAFVWEYDFGSLTPTVYLCPDYWNLPFIGSDYNESKSMTGAFVHEIAHVSGAGRDYTYNEAPSDRLSFNEAVANADNYRLFVMHH